MRRYDLGDTASFRREVRDLDGELADATVTLTIYPPGDAEPVEPEVTRVEQGIYDASYAELEVYGRYAYEWRATGAIEDVLRGQFYVADDEDDLPPLASVGRLGKKLGYTPDGAELDRADACLMAASELIRDVAGRTWVTEDTGALTAVPRRVRVICVEAAYRGFANPEGLSQRTVGDSSKSFDRSGREGGEAVYLTSDEERAIRRAAAGASMTSVTLVSPYGESPVVDEVLWS